MSGHQENTSRWTCLVSLPRKYFPSCSPGSAMFSQVLRTQFEKPQRMTGLPGAPGCHPKRSISYWPWSQWVKVAQSRLTLWDPTDCSPPGSFVHGHSLGKDTGVGCHARLQGIFPTQGSNPGLLCCRRILYHWSYQASPKVPWSQCCYEHQWRLHHQCHCTGPRQQRLSQPKTVASRTWTMRAKSTQKVSSLATICMDTSLSLTDHKTFEGTLSIG